MPYQFWMTLTNGPSFIAATFYYTFNGGAWSRTEGKNWLNYNVQECEWGETTGDAKNVCNAEGQFLGLSIEGTPGFVGVGMPPEIILLSSLESLKLFTLEWAGQIADLMPPLLAQLPLHTLFLQRNE